MVDIVQARSLYTKKVLVKYDEGIPQTNFLQSLFKIEISQSLDVSIEIRRGTKNIAVEVQRGGGSNGNNFSKSSEKIFRPRMYSESMAANQMSAYNIPFGLGAVNATTVVNAVNETGKKLNTLRDKISRAKELQCSEVLVGGTVTTKYDDVIDFGRLATSMVDLVDLGGYWSVVSADVESQLVAGATFIRNTGNSAATRFDILMSGDQLIALKKTDFYKDDANCDAKAQLQDIKRPIAKAGGSSYHGTLNAGSYIFDIWTYDAVYDTAAGVETRFTPNNKAVILPISDTGLILAHGGVPVMGTNGMPTAKAGQYVLRDFIDRKHITHTWYVESAPLATCYTPDRLYTMQTLGTGGGEG